MWKKILESAWKIVQETIFFSIAHQSESLVSRPPAFRPKRLAVKDPLVSQGGGPEIEWKKDL